ncbi:purine-nucleoside phosphorylase [Clostridium sp. 19966]|uniref:purine-nucleoside phosphorylase n=1 Tax=Clostridium sp. 19966 TaxID=2768166 RepID=UPI0028DF60FE|nr:purine-nucleoside phosphorylase [Clostridium sp. 19966]
MFYEKVKETADYIKKYISEEPTIGIILGSGLGSLVDIMENKKIIAYNEIPNFPVSQVAGHAGNLVFGRIGNQNIVAMQGRFHYYEGFEMKQVTYPIFVMKLLGVKQLIVTNACGGINKSFKPGDLMLLTDFINSVSVNPLIGTNDERFGTRFPDMSEPYNKELIKKAKDIADSLGIPYQQGIYTFFQGPYYETAAEIAAFGRMGSDAIGMSTVPETIAANYLSMKVLGIACITNMATGIAERKHSHEEVVRVANESSEKLCSWLKKLLINW